ncbi:hypothetical protein ACQP1O_22445 [Nocardia sp. CA-151230]|uniref:hypothetical protein n=1 Tax=Nocardia sp. CA-151230 TaxID=3239982 RepID=UPI003D90A77F
MATSDNGRVLFYPLRDGPTTHRLSESEIAARYRDRFAARDQMSATLDRMHTEGVSRIALSQTPWVAVSLHPSIAADKRRTGTDALRDADGFFTTWSTYTAPPLGGFPRPIRAYAGVRRAMIVSTTEFQDPSPYPQAELHYNGAGFAAAPVQASGDATPADEVSHSVEQDYLELQLVALTSLLAHHAANSGAGGDCEIRGQLLLAVLGDGVPGPVAVETPISTMAGWGIDAHQRADHALAVVAQQDPVRVTVDLDELVSDPRAVVRAAYALAPDILGAFAIADPCVLRVDGFLDLHRLHDRYRPAYTPWAQVNGLVDTP